MKGVCLLFTILFLLFSIPFAYSASSTPKSGDVGVKLEVKGPTPTTISESNQVSTISAPKITSAPQSLAQEEEPISTPTAQTQEKPKESAIFSTETLRQSDSILLKDYLWLKLLGLTWLIFIAVIVFLILRQRKKRKIEFQNVQNTDQAPGGTISTGTPTTSSPDESS